jgi:hypothetical protein
MQSNDRIEVRNRVTTEAVLESRQTKCVCLIVCVQLCVFNCMYINLCLNLCDQFYLPNYM